MGPNDNGVVPCPGGNCVQKSPAEEPLSLTTKEEETPETPLSNPGAPSQEQQQPTTVNEAPPIDTVAGTSDHPESSAPAPQEMEQVPAPPPPTVSDAEMEMSEPPPMVPEHASSPPQEIVVAPVEANEPAVLPSPDPEPSSASQFTLFTAPVVAILAAALL